MGISRLLRYLKENNAIKVYTATVESLIDGERNVIVVDAASWVYTVTEVACHNMDWLCGGQWHKQYTAIRMFLQSFVSAGAHLVFFFDTINPDAKRCCAHFAPIRQPMGSGSQ